MVLVSQEYCYFKKIGVVCLLAFLGWVIPGQAAEICPGIHNVSSVSLEFNDSEKILLCGKKSLENSVYQAWAEVPLSQARIHLQAFLQNQGFHQPKIWEENQNLYFEAGQKTNVKSARIKGAEELINLSRRRKLVGEVLTPDLITENEDWIKSELQTQGYPCPQVESQASFESGEILFNVNPGRKTSFGRVSIYFDPDFDSLNLTRYYAFSAEDEFNQILLKATEERTIQDGIVDRTEFIPNCSMQNQPLYQVYQKGEPHIWKFSALASTEVFIQFTTSWRKTRMDKRGSFLTLGSTVSARVQDLQAYYDWYFRGPEYKDALRPLLLIRRQNERPFRILSEEAQLMYLKRWDWGGRFSASTSIGPDMSRVKVQEGARKDERIRINSIQGELEISDYRNEVYRSQMSEGFRWGFTFKEVMRDWSSDFSGQWLGFEGEWTRNIKRDSPPSWIGAWRMGGSTTARAKRQELPPNFLHYLGGIDTLRGYSRLQLPNNSPGALSRLFTTFEIRSGLWSEKILPVAFIDLGWLGEEEFRLQGQHYQSPGMGIYWRSPLGPIRGSLAYGEVDGSQWQFFLSLGESF